MTKKEYEELSDKFNKSNTSHLSDQLEMIAYRDGESIAQSVMWNFISSLICSTISKDLNDHHDDNLDAESSYNKAMLVLKHSKIKLQTSVSLGLQSAVFHYTGENIDYYCRLEPIPPPPTTLPC